MAAPTMGALSPWHAVREEIVTVLSTVSDAQMSNAAALFTDRHRRWFCSGQGRSGLVAQMVAMRLMHVGFDAHAVGEATAPAIGSSAPSLGYGAAVPYSSQRSSWAGCVKDLGVGGWCTCARRAASRPPPAWPGRSPRADAVSCGPVAARVRAQQLESLRWLCALALVKCKGDGVIARPRLQLPAG
jgi:hypothetical protein